MATVSGGPRLLDQVRGVIRLKHYSIRTEESYVGWIKRFILFNAKRHPKDMGADEITRFLTHLAVNGRVAAATQNQALNARFLGSMESNGRKSRLACRSSSREMK